MAGIQKWALIAYVVLCVFLIARPSADKINRRAHALDKALSHADKEALAPAIASALSLPKDSLSAFLQDSSAKPSDLVFHKLLQNCGSENCDDNPAEAIMKAGMDSQQAIDYFDQVEKRIMIRLQAAENYKTNLHSKPLAKGSTGDIQVAHGLRSQPD